MTDRIHVRLVPKNKAGDSIRYTLPMSASPFTERIKPDPQRAELARAKCAAAHSVDAIVTPKHLLDATLSIDAIEKMFATKLVKKTIEPPANVPSSASTAPTSFLAPKEALTVPADLQDEIAFAYIPTPPEFCAVSFVPPNASVYHLRLSDVLRALNGGRCHRRGWTGRGVRVAMTDSGFARHPYFDQHGYSMRRVATPLTSNPAIDDSGHGTGESGNVMIMAPDCEFVGVKHNDYSVDALETAIAQDPAIITNSWGWNVDNRSFSDWQTDNPNLYFELLDIERTIADAIDDGIVVIFAAGNGHRMFPACMPGVIAVGGTTVQQDGDLEASSYASSFRSQLYPGRQLPDFCGIVGESGTGNLKGHIMLPVPNGSELEGENLPNSQSNKGWGIFSGTSAATPQVAGIVALMLGINPHLTSAQIRDILADTATDVTAGTTALGDTADVGHDLATGAGFVNSFEACLRAELLRPAGPVSS